MSSYTYWPYDEVSLDFEVPDGNITVRVPWMEASASGTNFNFDDIKTLSTKLHAKSLTSNDLGLVNDFFANFHQYPLAYILPTPKPGPLDKHTVANQDILLGSFLDVVTAMVQSTTDTSEKFNGSDFAELIDVLPRTNWEWDASSAVNFATMNHGLHPESLFSIARRYHILEVMSSDHGNDVFKKIESLSPDQFKKAVCRIVRQNHYVTEKCQQALEPALTIAEKASPFVREFMDEERGHDKILGKSLHFLGTTPEEIPVSVQTKALMNALKFIAGRNFLAFSMAVDAFERNNFDEVDPMAKLLQKGGFDKAAEFINLHMKINDKGNHDNVAQQFLSSMDLCDRDYALEAFRLMEVLSLIMCTVSKSALE